MVKDILFRFLRIIALTLYTLLGASFASDKSPLGGCTNVGTPEIKTFRDFASFACKESWKVHLVNIVRCVDYVEYPDSKRVVHYEAHAQWLDDEKFESSIWGYIRNTIARYATSDRLFLPKDALKLGDVDFLDSCGSASFYRYSGANWNAFLFKNCIKRALLSEYSADDLGDCLVDKTAELLRTSGCFIQNVKFLDKLRDAVRDIKIYARALKLTEYLKELKYCLDDEYYDALSQKEPPKDFYARYSAPYVSGHCAMDDGVLCGALSIENFLPFDEFGDRHIPCIEKYVYGKPLTYYCAPPHYFIADEKMGITFAFQRNTPDWDSLLRAKTQIKERAEKIAYENADEETRNIANKLAEHDGRVKCRKWVFQQHNTSNRCVLIPHKGFLALQEGERFLCSESGKRFLIENPNSWNIFGRNAQVFEKDRELRKAKFCEKLEVCEDPIALFADENVKEDSLEKFWLEKTLIDEIYKKLEPALIVKSAIYWNEKMDIICQELNIFDKIDNSKIDFQTSTLKDICKFLGNKIDQLSLAIHPQDFIGTQNEVFLYDNLDIMFGETEC